MDPNDLVAGQLYSLCVDSSVVILQYTTHQPYDYFYGFNLGFSRSGIWIALPAVRWLHLDEVRSHLYPVDKHLLEYVDLFFKHKANW